MKKIITLITGVFLYATVIAQCTTTGFDVCPEPGAFVTNFQNPVQVAGTGAPLTVGAKYKFDNISPGIDGIISIDKMVNAVMTGSGVANPDMDDDNAMDETGVPGSQAALFAPRIASDVTLTTSNRTGYVQFTVSFYTHTNGNAMPSALLAVPLVNPNFLHFDMDGHTVGNNGWFREIGYVQRLSALPLNPLNLGGAGTLLTAGANLSDPEGVWFRTNGATEERPDLSRCAQVIEKSVYTGIYTSVSFRFGYDYKAPSNNVTEGRPTRQYGSKFGCFSLNGGGALPVSFTGLAVNYNNGSSTIHWTTLQESNIKNYEILRSSDGVNYTSIGQVSSRNSPLVQKYSYVDNKVPQDTKAIYYRIKINEQDAKYCLSNIVAVKIEASDNNELQIVPNPAVSDIQLKFTATKSGNATIRIYDSKGKAVAIHFTEILTGNNATNIKVAKLSAGIYVVKLQTGNESYSSKLLIWK